MKSIGKGKAGASGFEAHFTQKSDASAGASDSRQVPEEPSSDKAPLTVDDYMDAENTMVEYTSDDLFGDLE